MQDFITIHGHARRILHKDQHDHLLAFVFLNTEKKSYKSTSFFTFLNLYPVACIGEFGMVILNAVTLSIDKTYKLSVCASYLKDYHLLRTYKIIKMMIFKEKTVLQTVHVILTYKTVKLVIFKELFCLKTCVTTRTFVLSVNPLLYTFPTVSVSTLCHVRLFHGTHTYGTYEII